MRFGWEVTKKMFEYDRTNCEFLDVAISTI